MSCDEMTSVIGQSERQVAWRKPVGPFPVASNDSVVVVNLLLSAAAAAAAARLHLGCGGAETGRDGVFRLGIGRGVVVQQRTESFLFRLASGQFEFVAD